MREYVGLDIISDVLFTNFAVAITFRATGRNHMRAPSEIFTRQGSLIYKVTLTI